MTTNSKVYFSSILAINIRTRLYHRNTHPLSMRIYLVCIHICSDDSDSNGSTFLFENSVCCLLCVPRFTFMGCFGSFWAPHLYYFWFNTRPKSSDNLLAQSETSYGCVTTKTTLLRTEICVGSFKFQDTDKVHGKWKLL